MVHLGYGTPRLQPRLAHIAVWPSPLHHTCLSPRPGPHDTAPPPHCSSLDPPHHIIDAPKAVPPYAGARARHPLQCVHAHESATTPVIGLIDHH